MYGPNSGVVAAGAVHKSGVAQMFRLLVGDTKYEEHALDIPVFSVTIRTCALS